MPYREQRSPVGRTDIAVIGMAGRFAGASDVDSFWDLMCSGTDAISEIPRSRYDVDPLYDPTPRTPGRTVSRWGSFIERMDEFDAQFFGISPREAHLMDPQQRMLLEVTSEALDDAGYPSSRIAGSDAGVFVGQIGGDYWHLQLRRSESLTFYGMTGAASRAMGSGRLSFAFDLRGPSLTLDTACSSSLVAVHLAAQSIRTGECEVAVAGGVNLILLPEEGVVYSGAGMLSTDGRCKFGDASGDGFVRSDGVGMVVLKSLDRALADGDRVRAVILGSAVGNDGRSGGYLVTPAVEGQRLVLQRAYRMAGISPADVDYIEAHGTGTRAGDPVELEALGSVVASGRPVGQPCLVGSVKTNIGHAEGAAGVASLIKAVLCLEHAEVPPSLHFTSPNPDVAWDTLPLRIPTEITPLPDRGRPLVAAVSSFGFSGTNAHVVLASADSRPGQACADPHPGRAELLTLSAGSGTALAQLATSYADYLGPEGRGRDLRLLDVCHSAAVRRRHQESRAAIVAASHDEAVSALRELADGHPGPGTSWSEYVGEGRPRIAFVFPGQGSQWAGMGRELLRGEPAFARALEECDRAIKAEAGWSVAKLIRDADPEPLARLGVVQPALWAMEVALAALWRSWGVEPDIVVGHSMGEVAAACVAGALSVADAAAVICRRSDIAGRLSGRGAMAWAEIPASVAAELLVGHESSVAIAAANSPRSTLLSGSPDELGEILAELDRREIFNRWVRVDFASHSPQVDEIREDLLAALKDLAPRPGIIPVRSTLLGTVIDGSGMDAEYWARNIREPVNFSGAVAGLLDDAGVAFVEISPHPVLVASIRETGEACGRQPVATGSLRRDEPERPAMLSALGQLYAAGAQLDWDAVTAGGEYVALPGYPWQRDHYWFEETEQAAEPGRAPHPLLGFPARPEDGAMVWEGHLDIGRNAYICDHRVQGTVIVPGTAYIELFTAAARQVLGDVPVAISDVRCPRAIFLEDSPVTLRVLARRTGDGLECEVHARTDPAEPPVLRAAASARAIAPGEDHPEPPAAVQARCTGYQAGADFYAWHAARGNQWEGAFQGIEEVWRGAGEALARLRCPAAVVADLSPFEFHPALLDACGQVLAAARSDTEAGQEYVFVLGGLTEVRIYQRPVSRMWSHARLVPAGRADSFAGDIAIYGDDRTLIADLVGLRLQYLRGEAPPSLTTAQQAQQAQPVRPVRPSAATGEASSDDWLYEVCWAEADRDHDDPPADSGAGTWLVLADTGPAGRAIVGQLRDTGCRVVVVTNGTGLAKTGTSRYRAAQSSSADIASILADIARTGSELRGIVHLWSLGATPDDVATGGEIRRAGSMVCGSAISVIQALRLAKYPEPIRLWLVTRDSQAVVPGDEVPGLFQAPLWGLGRALAAESRGLRTALVDLDQSPESVLALVREMLDPDEENQLAFRQGRRLVARLRRHQVSPGPLPVNPPATGAYRIGTTSPGILDAVGPIPIQRRTPGPGEVRIRVRHAALNYRDVLMATGLYPGEDGNDPQLGWECAGVVEAIGPDVTSVAEGDEVMAIAAGGLAGHVVADAALVVRKPERLTLLESATMPAAFVTAYYGLHDIGRVSGGERVLIHSATGGVGLAAIQVAQWRGAHVYGTAGSEKKRALLSVLGVRHVSDSRSLAFAEEFRSATGGAGFDVIFNTLAGEAIAANLSLMAPYGRYVELSKRDIFEDRPIGMAAFGRNLSFSHIDIAHMVVAEPRRTGTVLQAVAELAETGVFRPLPYTEYPVAQAVDAFRLMARSGQVGKVVLTFPEDGAASLAPARALSDVVRPDASYLVTGGLGGIGGRVAEWLADHGARHILLTGRSPLPQTGGGERARITRELRQRGATVEYAAVDVADGDDMRRVLQERSGAGWPAFRGVLHAAGTIEYAPLTDVTDEALANVLRAKIEGGWTLHDIFRDDQLDFFALFSSASAILGSPFLGAYAAGNAFLDALAHRRRSLGLPGTSVNWGFWDEVGMVARKERDDGRRLQPRGMAAFRPSEGIAVLDRLLSEEATQVTVLRVDWPEWANAYPSASADPLVRELTGNTRARPPAPITPLAPITPPAPVARPAPITPIAPADGGLESEITALVTRVLGLRAENVVRDRPLSRLGMDSLMAVELRNLIDKELGVNVPVVKILNGGTVATLARLVGESRHPAASDGSR